MMETLWLMGTWCNDITVKSSSDGGSGDDKVLQKIANAGFVDAASKKVIRNYKLFLSLTTWKVKFLGRGWNTSLPKGEMMKLVHTLRFISYRMGACNKLHR